MEMKLKINDVDDRRKRIQLMYGYFVDLRTCGGYFADRRPQLGPQNTHWLVRRSAGLQVRKIPEAASVHASSASSRFVRQERCCINPC